MAESPPSDSPNIRPERQAPASDMFKLPTDAERIAPVSKIILPPDVVRKQRIARTIIAVIVLIVAAIIAVIVQRIVHVMQRSSAVADATADGRLSSIERAIELCAGDDVPALSARLRAMRALAGGEENLTELARALPDKGAAEDEGERAIAAIYLALLQHRPAEATRVAADNMPPSEEVLAETDFAKGVAALATGQLEPAAASAQVALHRLAPSGRAIGLVADIALRAPNPAAAIGLLEALPPEVRRSPPARLRFARAKIALGLPAEAEPELEAIASSDEATPAEKAWASLLRCVSFARTGSRAEAMPHCTEAGVDDAPGDETYRLLRGEAALWLRDLATADAALAPLTDEGSIDPTRRALLRGWLALESNALPDATTALAAAGETTLAVLLRARLAEAKGELDAADPQYRRITADPSYAPFANAALARLARLRGRPQNGRPFADAALAAAPTHPDVVPEVVETLIATGSAQEALTAVERAVQAHANDPRLLHAKGRAELALGRNEAAVATLRAAASSDEGNADVLADLGEAERRTNARDEAGRAFARALGIEDKHPTALIGSLALALDKGALDEAAQWLERADAAEIRDERLDVQRGRLFVSRGDGWRGFLALRGALDRWSRSLELRTQAGDLLLQADQPIRARPFYERAESLADNSLEARLANLVAIVLSPGGFRAVENVLERLLEEHPEIEQQPRYWVIRARAELAQDHNVAAKRFADRASALAEGSTETQLLLGQIAAAMNRDPVPHFRRALENVPQQPRAAGHLALRLGGTEEGCALAQRYRNAAPEGDLQRSVREVATACAEAARAAAAPPAAP